MLFTFTYAIYFRIARLILDYPVRGSCSFFCLLGAVAKPIRFREGLESFGEEVRMALTEDYLCCRERR